MGKVDGLLREEGRVLSDISCLSWFLFGFGYNVQGLLLLA